MKFSKKLGALLCLAAVFMSSGCGPSEDNPAPAFSSEDIVAKAESKSSVSQTTAPPPETQMTSAAEDSLSATESSAPPASSQETAVPQTTAPATSSTPPQTPPPAKTAASSVTAAGGTKSVPAVSPSTPAASQTDVSPQPETPAPVSESASSTEASIPPEAEQFVSLSADPDCAALASEIFTLTNQVRAANGLAPLQSYSVLTQAAQLRAEESAQNKTIDHVRADGRAFHTILDDLGLKPKCSWWSENAAYSSVKPEAQFMIDSWMASTMGHKENILREKDTHLAVGVAVSSDGGYYFIQEFVQQKAGKSW